MSPVAYFNSFPVTRQVPRYIAIDCEDESDVVEEQQEYESSKEL